MRFDKLAERQILKAQAEGQLDELSGVGKPLEKHGGDTAEAAGYRIMAEAGALPQEIELNKAIAEQRRLLSQSIGPARKDAMARLADLEMLHAIAQEARRAFSRNR